MKASDLFVKCLETEGIEVIFGIPGEENADFILSLANSKKIKFVLTRHEQGAAFMAEVYGRLTGTPAGCLGTLGPGATNLVTGVADSNMDRAPILALTGQGGTYRLHKESHQIMDVVSMFRPITKWSSSIYHAASIPEIIRKAVRIARSEKPGAVHIELPEDIAKCDIEAQPITPHRFRRPAPDDIIVDKAYQLLQRAKRPVILAGNGTIRKRASKQLRRFCEKSGIGVVNTFMAKGAVDMDAPYCLYTVGLSAKDWPSLAIEDADLIITIGYDMVEYHPRLWNPQTNNCILHIDFAPAEIDNNYHPEIELIGDLAHTLWMLNERQERTPLPKYDLSLQHRVRAKMGEDLAEYATHNGSGPQLPQKILWDVRQVMGAEDILLSDVGAHKMWIARHYQCHVPNTCLIPNGFCSMGFALPGLIGAAFAAPERKVLGISGDGGFLMNVQEMETAARLNLKITLMVWQDHQFGLIAWKQMNQFGTHTDLAFSNPHWEQLAQAFGWNCHTVEKSAHIQQTLRQALNEEGPSLMVVPVDYSQNMELTKRLGEITCDI